MGPWGGYGNLAPGLGRLARSLQGPRQLRTSPRGALRASDGRLEALGARETVPRIMKRLWPCFDGDVELSVRFRHYGTGRTTNCAMDRATRCATRRCSYFQVRLFVRAWRVLPWTAPRVCHGPRTTRGALWGGGAYGPPRTLRHGTAAPIHPRGSSSMPIGSNRYSVRFCMPSLL